MILPLSVTQQSLGPKVTKVSCVRANTDKACAGASGVGGGGGLVEAFDGVRSLKAVTQTVIDGGRARATFVIFFLDRQLKYRMSAIWFKPIAFNRPTVNPQQRLV